MSWASKPDYCGISVANKLLVKSVSLNNSGQYLEKHGQNGAYAATKPFGVRAAPTNTYVLVDDVELVGKHLGVVKQTPADTGQKYARESFSWTTGADEEPTVSATAVEVDSGASLTSTETNRFSVPTFSLSPDHVAQIPEFQWRTNEPADVPFELSGSGCELLKCNGEMSCTIKTNDRNGDPKAHDVTNGHIVINITIAQYGDTEPTVNVYSGWDISSPLTCEEPDSDMPTWTMALSRPLVKAMAS